MLKPAQESPSSEGKTGEARQAAPPSAPSAEAAKGPVPTPGVLREAIPDEPLLFERSSRGRTGASLAAGDTPKVDPKRLFGDLVRGQAADWPQVSEPEAVRHFVRLSSRNYAIDKGMVALGSCTMKYNPKVNEWAARLEGFALAHPLQPPTTAQGNLELMWRLQQMLAAICGMDGVSLHPAAGAQGELAGLMMIRAYHNDRGRNPHKVLVPTSAHGTNPASCRLSGFEAVSIPSREDGRIGLAEVEPLLDDEVAAIMITNPNTLGLFEEDIVTIARAVHDRGGLVYGDGANLNALVGKVRPGDLGIDIMQFNLHKTFTTPHGGGGPGCGPLSYKACLADYAPMPSVKAVSDGSFVLDFDRPKSIGRLRTFYGNFAMMVRAYTFLREMGAQGLRRATELAVLNANYLRVRLSEFWTTPYPDACMHEVVLSDRRLRGSPCRTTDVAKRLIDYGFHPPTVYFPLLVAGALLIEPTENETKDTLDRFVDAMRAIALEVDSNPQRVLDAPHSTAIRRANETLAARNPKLRWQSPVAVERAAADGDARQPTSSRS